MPYVLLVVATLALGLLVYVLAGCRPSGENPRPPAPTVFDVSLTEKPATRAELAQRLKRLAASPPPAKLAPGAMCYAPHAPDLRFEYVCPTCGERTVYDWLRTGQGRDADRDIVCTQTTETFPHDLTEYRRLIADVWGIAMSLDESQFCKKCRPDVAKPKIVLVVKLPGGEQPHRVEDVSRLDLTLLSRFASGSDCADLGAAGERPLKDYLPRIRELLGIPPASTERK